MKVYGDSSRIDPSELEKLLQGMLREVREHNVAIQKLSNDLKKSLSKDPLEKAVDEYIDKKTLQQ